MKKLLLSFVATVLAVAGLAQSQPHVFTDWTGSNGKQYFFYKSSVKTDIYGYVYVAGATINVNNNYDILVAKYDPKGNLLWIQQYNGPGNGNDAATAMYVDAHCNVYVTGYVTNLTNVDAVTIKYDSLGNQQWVASYNGTGNGYDCGSDIVADSIGNVYVTGSSMNTHGYYEIYTIRYNIYGNQNWERTYISPDSLNDVSAKIYLSLHNMLVLGIAQHNAVSYSFCAVNYDTIGNYQGSKTGNADTTAINQIGGLATDASGNVYIAGSAPVPGQGYDMDIIKLDSYLNIVWDKKFDGGYNLDDFANGIAVNSNGDIIITGYTTQPGHGKNICTLKYYSNGNLAWYQTYDDTSNGDDEANAITLDASDNIYITGYITNQYGNTDYCTIKYDDGGNMIWEIETDGDNHLNDQATNIALSDDGGIVITGESETEAGKYEYYTVKYIEREIIDPADCWKEPPNNSFLYYQNKGQLIGTNDTLIPYIKYYTNNSNPAFYIWDDRNSFVFSHIDTSSLHHDTLCRVDMVFFKGKSASKTYSMDEQSSYLNYYLGHCPKGITGLHGNEKLITCDIYDNIDLMYSSNQNGLKYYFIVYPGGDPSQIVTLFQGCTQSYINNNLQLVINTTLGSLVYSAPTAYQLSSNDTVIPLTGTCKWQCVGQNIFDFDVPQFGDTIPLIIEVDRGHSVLTHLQNGNVDWSTYFGGSGNDVGEAITTNTNGSVFVTGITSSSDFPVYYGISMSHTGNDNIFIAKFDKNAVRRWITLYGGSENDRGYGIVCSQHWVYVTGETTSADFPTQNPGGGAYYNSLYGGVGDAFVLRIDTSDVANSLTCDWATYFGSCWDTKAYSIDADNNGNVYIVGETWLGTCPSNSLFPLVNPGGNAYYQHVYGGNNMSTIDGFIAKFNINDSLVWSTLFGGKHIGGGGNDMVNDVKCSSTGDVYITGTTESTGEIITSPCAALNDSLFPLCDPGGGSYLQNYINMQVSFVARFSSASQLLWSSFFGGHTRSEGTGITVNSSGDIYITGLVDASLWTDSTLTMISNNACMVATNTGFPSCQPWQKYAKYPYNSRDDIYLARFTSDEKLEWATFYGGRTDENNLPPFTYRKSPKIVCDNYNNIFLAGSAGIDLPYNDFPSCPHINFYNQSTIASTSLNSSSDAFLLWFDPANQLKWATLYGGDESGGYGNDVASALTVYKNYVYITGFAESSTFPYYCPPAISGIPYCDSILDGSQDAFIARFNLKNYQEEIHENPSTNNSFSVYPNPANDNVTLQINGVGIKSFKVSIYDAIGQLIYNTGISKISLPISRNINIQNYPPGIYMIVVSLDNKILSNRIIKF